MADQITQMTPGPKDLLAQLGGNVYRQAYDDGMGLSAWLDFKFGKDWYQRDKSSRLDAYQMLLREADIRTESVPRMGFFASKYEDFNRNEHTRALIPEWIRRNWLKAQTGRPVNMRSLYTSGDQTPGSWANPYSEAEDARWDQQIAPAIPLDRLVAVTTPIDSDSFRAHYLTHSATESRFVRVGESAEIPRAKLTASDRTIDLYKFGRALEASYEVLRRQRVDVLALHIQRMSVQSEVDKVAAAIDVLVNGDGNSGTAATNHDLTDMDDSLTAPVTVADMTLKAWLNFKIQFEQPYMMDVALARAGNVLELFLLDTGSANIPLVMIAADAAFGGFSQINPGLRDAVAVGWTSDAPAQQVVGVDTRFALQYVTEVGSNISETERFITRQTEVLTMTEVNGFAILDANATRTLTLNA